MAIEDRLAAHFEQRDEELERQQKLAALRSQAAARAATQPKQENLWQRIWFDDFRGDVPVVGPAVGVASDFASQKVIGPAYGTYLDATEGISRLVSAGALAGNPEYWKNRDPESTLLTDTIGMQPGRALDALADAYNPTDFGNVYSSVEGFDITDEYQRNRYYENNVGEKIGTGIVDGINTWFLDPLVIGGKAVKVAKVGTQMRGLKNLPIVGTGLTNRTLYGQRRGVNDNVMKALETEADVAMMQIDEVGEASNTIGVVASRIVRGDGDDLLKDPYFKGSSRDLMASVGATIDNQRDAVVFAAAAAGSRKYQQILADEQATTYLTLKNALGSNYEQLLLNTPRGAERAPLLDDLLESDVKVVDLVNDMSRRDPEFAVAFTEMFGTADMRRLRSLQAAGDLIDANPEGLVERIGGVSAGGMRVAAAWRDGKKIRKTAIKRKSRAGERKQERLKSSYGTGPALYETVFQLSANAPRIRLIDWVGGYHASGYIDIRGFNEGKAVDELRAALSDSKSVRKDPDFINNQINLYLNAGTSPMARMEAVKRIEKNVFKRIAADEGVENWKVLREVYRRVDKNRAKTIKSFRERKYGVDADNGDAVFASPALQSQLETSMPMMRFDIMQKTARLAKKLDIDDIKVDDLNLAPGSKIASESVKTFIDEAQSLWKWSVLMRGGYTIRNTVEGWLRSWAFLGTVPGLTPPSIARTTRNTFYNSKRGMLSRRPLRSTKAGLRHAKLAERKAVEKINDTNRAIFEAQRKRAALLADDPAAATNDLDQSILALQREVNELSTSAERVRAKVKDIESRRRYGSGDKDTAFGGELNSELGDLYRRLSSADKTKNLFLESSWFRGQQELLSATSYKRIQPGKPQYFQELVQSVRQFRADPLARRLLDGEEIGDAVRWAKSAEARSWRRKMQIAPSEVEGHVTKISKMITDYLPTDDAVRLAREGVEDSMRYQEILGGLPAYVARGANKTGDGVPALRPIHGRAVQMATTDGVYYKARKTIVDNTFRWLGSQPESALVRHPFYAEVWDRRFQQLLHNARRQGREETDELLQKINSTAHRYAMRQTNEVLYTIERYSNLAGMLRWMSPFVAAWENSFKVWTRMIVNDPSILARANILWNMPNKLGMVVDDKGNKVEGRGLGFLGRSNNDYIVVPKVVNDLLSPVTGEVPLRIPQGGINVVTPGETPYLPGFGPVVMMPVGQFLLKSRPDAQKFVRDTIGEGAYESFFAPFGRVQGFEFDAIAPAWVRRVEQFISKESDEQYMRTASSMMRDAMVDWYKSGGRPENQPDFEEILDRAGKHTLFRAFASGALPVPVTRTSKYQIELDHWRNLMRDDTMTYTQKIEAFVDKWGDDYLPLVSSTSKNTVPGIGPTIETYDLLKSNDSLTRQLASLGPEAVGIIGATAPVGEFDVGVYDWLNENNIPGLSVQYRGARSVAEMREASTLQSAWREYRMVKEERDDALARAGLKSITSAGAEDIKARWDQFVKVDMVQKYGREWSIAYNQYENQTPMYLNAIDVALQDPKFMSQNGNSPLWRKIKEYMTVRAQAIEAINQGATATEVGEIWDQWREDNRYSSLEFSDFYDRFLDNDDIRDYGLGLL